MIDEEGFDITIQESTLSFTENAYELKVRKIVKYQQIQLVDGELLDHPEFIAQLIQEMKDRIKKVASL